MRLIFVLLIGLLESSNAFAMFCSFRYDGVKLICTSDYRSCMSQAKRMNGGECRSVSNTEGLPPSLNEADSKAYCLWTSHNNELKNMGCMAQAFCERSMQQYENTVCVKGSITDPAEIKRVLSTHIESVKREEHVASNQAVEKENKILQTGDSSQIRDLIRDKKGKGLLKSKDKIDWAKKLLKPICAKGDAESCYILSDFTYDLQSNWKTKDECEQVKESYEYLKKSCLLGFREACRHVEGQPEQVKSSDDDLPNYTCELKPVGQDILNMIEKCSSNTDSDSCLYAKKSKIGIDKMSLEQLMAEGDNAEKFNETEEAERYYSKACEIKKNGLGCANLAFVLFPKDEVRAKAIFDKTCPSAKNESVLSVCKSFSETYLRQNPHGDTDE